MSLFQINQVFNEVIPKTLPKDEQYNILYLSDIYQWNQAYNIKDMANNILYRYVSNSFYSHQILDFSRNQLIDFKHSSFFSLGTFKMKAVGTQSDRITNIKFHRNTQPLKTDFYITADIADWGKLSARWDQRPTVIPEWVLWDTTSLDSEPIAKLDISPSLSDKKGFIFYKPELPQEVVLLIASTAGFLTHLNQSPTFIAPK
jgi:hypothetical protein